MGRPTLALERQLLAQGARAVVGLDEVGRGALAGPVAVGAVMVTARCVRRAPAGIRDSKDLTMAARGRLATAIDRWSASSAVGMASPAEVDALGVLVALRLAAGRSLAQLRPTSKIDVILLDGNVDYLSRGGESDPSEPAVERVITEVKADSKRTSVAAASIVAKVARDDLMRRLAADEDRYGWERNKGYASAEHTAALRRWGPSGQHRLSWRLPGLPSASRDDGMGQR
ncbi:MAG: ribonuclease HII [Actinobacteria bacterium]|nr:ribonuclease HII [Actinomycetota bacterium]MCB9412870.1 ribonuclease HII [Actinomycetota bacterium]